MGTKGYVIKGMHLLKGAHSQGSNRRETMNGHCHALPLELHNALRTYPIVDFPPIDCLSLLSQC
jgi:hypothetical protein